MYILNETYLQQFSVNKKFDFKETDTKPQRFFLILCHVLIWIIRRQDAIFIENKEDKTIQKMLKVCAGQKNVTGARASQ